MSETPNEPSAAPVAQAEPTPRQIFDQLITRLAHELDDRAQSPLPRGEIAALRREDGAMSPTFYKLAARVLEEVLGRHPSEPILMEAERRWARIVHALAKLGGQHRPSSPSLGAALASADFSEPRFLRLLRAEGDALDAALRAALAPLVQKAVTFDASDLAALVLSAPYPTDRFHFEDGETVRRRLARDYYRAQRKETEGAQS